MKRKVLMATLTAMLAGCLVSGLSACDEQHTHTYVESVTAPTCTEQGYTIHTCDCGESYVDTYVSALGHTYNQEIANDKYLKSAATCENKAVYYKSCICGEKGRETFEYGVELGHEYTNYVSNNDATCTKNGTETAKCNHTGCKETDTRTEENSALGHDFTNYISNGDATCIKDGTKTAKCNRANCSALDTKNDDDAKATGKHTYSTSIITEATCSTQGVKKYECTQCDDFYTENFDLASYSASEIYDLSKASVGEIITYNKSGNELALGTGFVYSADGKIVTNYHVIEDAYSAKITINGTTYTVQSVLAYDKTIDLVVLKISTTGLTVLDICTNEHSVGKTVYAFGSSKGLTATFSQGIITYADREIDGVHYVQHDAAISSGNSGGPLINQYGEIIGINTMTMKDSQNLNFAISVKELSNLVYGTPLTVAEFYEKECDVFKKVKNYIIQNGTYDSEDRKYTLYFALTSISTTLRYRTVGYYHVDDDYIELGNFVTDGSNSYMVFITIDEVDGVYNWVYVDSSDYAMMGTLYASTWTSDSLLGISNYSVPSSLISSLRKLASSMINLLISDIKYDYANINIKASDFGFIHFD